MSRLEQVLALVGTVLVVLSVALPVRVSTGFSTGLSALPFEQFLLAVLFALLVAGYATPSSEVPARQRARRLRGVGIGGVLLSAAVLVLVTLDDGYRPGAGLWLSLAGTLLVAVAGVLRFRRR